MLAAESVPAKVNTSYSMVPPLMDVTVTVDPAGRPSCSAIASSKYPFASAVCGESKDDVSRLLAENDPVVVIPKTSTSWFRFGTVSSPEVVTVVVEDAAATLDVMVLNVVVSDRDVLMVDTAAVASSDESALIVIS